MKKTSCHAAAVLAVFFLSGCSIFNIGKEPDIVRLERKLNDTNKKIEKISEDVRKILAMVGKHETRIQYLETSAGGGGGGQVAKIPERKEKKPKSQVYIKDDRRAEKLYKTAIAFFNRKRYDRSASLFNSFLNSYPDHRRANYVVSWLKHIEKVRPATTAEATKPVAKKTAPPTVYEGRKSASASDKLYNLGLDAFKGNRVGDAMALFQRFIRDNPNHYLADNAMYWIGECQYSQNRFYDAVSTFKEIVKKFPKGNKVPDALLKIGYAYLALDDPENARRYLEELVQKHPLSKAGVKAEEKLKSIKTRKEQTPPADEQDALQVWLRAS